MLVVGCKVLVGYKAILISTIVDRIVTTRTDFGYKAILISTIVDNSRDSPRRSGL